MRISFDLKSLKDGTGTPIQTSQTPPTGSGVSINGQVIVACPPNVKISPTASDYLLPVDGEDVSSKIFARLLLQYPQYGHIYFNPLLSSKHINELDYNGSFFDRRVSPSVEYPSRFQAGRSFDEGGDHASLPCYTAILPINDRITPNRPGVLTTTDIYIKDYALDCEDNPEGSDKFMVYWKLFTMESSPDVLSIFENSPCVKTLIECDQEPLDFEVFISIDSGGSWTQVRNLEPIAFCDKSDRFRIAFVNGSNTKYYLGHFVVMF